MKELNKIEGFDPMQFARTIQDANGNEELYLDVQYRKMWFRLCNPTGKIVKKIHTFDGNLAVVEARVYLDRNDAPENFVSNAFAQRFVDPSNQEYGNRYLESAETAAVGRALADAGYGLQFCMEPDLTPVDMGQTPVSGVNRSAPQPVQQYQPIQPQQQSIPQYNTPVRQPQNNSRYNGNGNTAPVRQPQNSSQYNGNGYTEPVQQPQYQLTSQTPLEEVVQNMPYEDAVKVVYHCNGKHNNKTLGQIAAEDIRSIEWIVNTYNGRNNLLKGAAMVILNRHMGQK